MIHSRQDGMIISKSFPAAYVKDTGRYELAAVGGFFTFQEWDNKGEEPENSQYPRVPDDVEGA